MGHVIAIEEDGSRLVQTSKSLIEWGRKVSDSTGKVVGDIILELQILIV